MKTRVGDSFVGRRCLGGWTLLEVGLVVLILFLVGTILLPWVLGRMARPKGSGGVGVRCVNNQKQLVLAYTIWASDHEDRFPWQVGVQEGGVIPLGGMEGMDLGNLANSYRSVSNELTVARSFICPAETVKKRVEYFDGVGADGAMEFGVRNVSYALGWDATRSQANSVLVADANLSGGGDGMGRVVGGKVKEFGVKLVSNLPMTNVLMWGQDYHKGVGNIGLKDGSVQRVGDKEAVTVLRGAVEGREPAGKVGVMRYSVRWVVPD